MEHSDSQTFYIMSSRGYLTTFTALPDMFYTLLNNQDEVNTFMQSLICGNLSNVETPVVFHQTEGRVMRDFLDMRLLSAYLISSRVKNLFELNDVTGWTVYPIILYDKKGNEINDYYGFSVTGKGGYLSDDKQSYNVKQWDGSDIFMVEHNIIVITTRVMSLLKKNHVSALEFIPLEKWFKVELS